MAHKFEKIRVPMAAQLQKKTQPEHSGFIDCRRKVDAGEVSAAGTSGLQLSQSVVDRSGVTQRKAGLKAENVALSLENYQGQGVEAHLNMAGMIGDEIKRVFKNAAELNKFNKGQTEHIGVVKKHWVRLDPNKFHVLGEEHEDPKGTAPDVIRGVRTKRFMYEPFHDLPDFSDIKGPTESWGLGGVQATLSDLPKQDSLGDQAGDLSPSLENMAFKIAPAFYLVKAFAKASPFIKGQDWKYDPSETYSGSERAAHYLRFAILIAKDVSKWKVSKDSAPDKWGKCYLANKAILDTMALKRGDDRKIWLYEMCPNLKGGTMAMLTTFADLGYDWVAAYTKLLGAKNKDKAMFKVGQEMGAKKDESPFSDDHPVNKARELYMVQKLKAGKGAYLIAGMGDDHRKSLKKTHGGLADEWHNVLKFMKNRNDTAKGEYDNLGS